MKQFNPFPKVSDNAMAGNERTVVFNEMIDALQNLADQVWAHHKMDVRKDYSLMVAEAAARRAITRATGDFK